MERGNKSMTCIVGANMQSVVRQANELGIQKEDIVSLNVLGEQIYLIYYR